ncbi:hypothetical protein RIF29_00799 [Crotalaria pallida]|uniref:Uncharacterized protein n=1 Tax=Crotalaria pallida TaxID=3830 RepID=A0AAN9IX53_CROPI
MFGHESSSCRKATKKVWIEKSKLPNEEPVVIEDQDLYRPVVADQTDVIQENTTMNPNNETLPSNAAVKAKEPQLLEKVTSNKGESSMPNVVVDLSSQEEGEWTPVCTSRKAMMKNAIQKGDAAQLVSNG